MPRKRKKKKSTVEQIRKRRGDRDKLLADFWTGRIRAGLQKQKTYRETANEVLAYLEANHSNLFEDEAVQKFFMDFKGASTISIPLVARMKNSLAPRLYYAKPRRTVTPRTREGVLVGLARTMETYLNYTVKEAKFKRQLRKCVVDGLVRGRLILMQGWDDVKEIVTSFYLSSVDLIFDPDFNDIEDARWIAIRKRAPLWEVKERITETWRLKNLKDLAAQSSKKSQDTDPSPDRPESRNDEEAIKTSSPIVEYWVVLSKMGAGFRGIEDAKNYKDNSDYVRLEIVVGHDTPLQEGSWDVPFYLDHEWPLSYNDLLERVDSAYPESISGEVLSCQKGADLLSSLRITSCKNRDRFVAMVDAQLGDLDQETLRHGTAADFLSVQVPNGTSLKDLVHVLDFGEGSRESGAERQFLLDQIDQTTGITQAIHGAAPTGAVDRSATATQVKTEASAVRVGDYKERVEELMEDAARKEFIMARLILEADEISPFVSSGDIGLFYVRLETPGGAVVPVQNFAPEDNEDEEDVRKPLSLVDIEPLAATYFESVEEAGQAAMELWESMQTSEDQRILELRDQVLALGIAEEDQLPVAISIAPVDAERVWEDTDGMTAKDLMREFSYVIEAGGGVKVNPEQEREHATILTQTVLPTALQIGDFDSANKILGLWQEAHEMAKDKRIQLKPPAPPPMEGQNGQGSSGSEPSANGPNGNANAG